MYKAGILFLVSLMVAPIVTRADNGLKYFLFEAGIYRGPSPGPAGLEELKSAGVKTIINLDNRPGALKQEQEYAKKIGVDYISIPLSIFSVPSRSKIKKILDLLVDPSRRPVYLHCQFGRDRTGLVLGLYRVKYDNWTPGAAYEEMLHYGYRAATLTLSYYYFRETSWTPPIVKEQDSLQMHSAYL